MGEQDDCLLESVCRTHCAAEQHTVFDVPAPELWLSHDRNRTGTLASHSFRKAPWDNRFVSRDKYGVRHVAFHCQRTGTQVCESVQALPTRIFPTHGKADCSSSSLSSSVSGYWSAESEQLVLPSFTVRGKRVPGSLPGQQDATAILNDYIGATTNSPCIAVFARAQSCPWPRATRKQFDC